jgi:hypothetical protein
MNASFIPGRTGLAGEVGSNTIPDAADSGGITKPLNRIA